MKENSVIFICYLFACLFGSFFGFQVKKFLQEDRTAVLVINFNHEMKNGEKVIPALVRQVRSEVGQYVSTHHRETGHWPTLEHVVRSNKRLFIIIDSQVKGHVSYGQNNWIHSEELVRSTWRADVTVKGDLYKKNICSFCCSKPFSLYLVRTLWCQKKH